MRVFFRGESLQDTFKQKGSIELTSHIRSHRLWLFLFINMVKVYLALGSAPDWYIENKLPLGLQINLPYRLLVGDTLFLESFLEILYNAKEITECQYLFGLALDKEGYLLFVDEVTLESDFSLFVSLIGEDDWNEKRGLL